MSMKVEGAKQIADALQALPDKVQRTIMRDALRDGAEIVLAEARFNAPVKTGALAAGLNIRVSTSGDGGGVAKISSGSSEYYGNMQEFGTKKMKPHPFLARALQDTQGEAVEQITATLKEGIEEQAF